MAFMKVVAVGPASLGPRSFAAVLTASAVVLAGCSGSGDDSTDATSPAAETTTSVTSAPGTAVPDNHNAADVTFATDMIPHHRQALTLAELVPDRTDNPDVIALAEEITAAQQPEIDQLEAMLNQWGAPLPDGHSDHHADMAGMVDQATLDRLETLRGGEFDTLWLQSMIGHHEGAVQMAETEIADGENSAAKELATNIIADQQAEIDKMNEMMGG